MQQIVLHGEMRNLFGHKFTLEVQSLAEAVRALGSQIKGFREYVKQNSFRVHVARDKKRLHLDESTIEFRVGKGALHIVPVIEGSGGRSGVGKIIVGLLIAATAFATSGASLGAMGALGTGIGVGGITFGNVAMFGLAMAATGVSQMLTAKQSTKRSAQEAQNNSFMINGDLNTAEQGGPVPLAYGRCRVGSVVISSGINAFDIPLDSPTYI